MAWARHMVNFWPFYIFIALLQFIERTQCHEPKALQRDLLICSGFSNTALQYKKCWLHDVDFVPCRQDDSDSSSSSDINFACICKPNMRLVTTFVRGVVSPLIVDEPPEIDGQNSGIGDEADDGTRGKLKQMACLEPPCYPKTMCKPCPLGTVRSNYFVNQTQCDSLEFFIVTIILAVALFLIVVVTVAAIVIRFS
ncbi:MAG: hypothetical protein MHMPM18_000247 [Marteilia pararefringens]